MPFDLSPSGMTIKDFILSRTLGTQRKTQVNTTDRLMGSEKNAKRQEEALQLPKQCCSASIPTLGSVQ